MVKLDVPEEKPLPEGVLARVVKFVNGCLVMDRETDLAVGDTLLLAYLGRPICGAKVVWIEGVCVRTDFNLFFASPGDCIMKGKDE